MIELYQRVMTYQILNINHNYTLTNIKNEQLGPLQINYPSKNQLNDPEFQIGGQINNGLKVGKWCEIERRGKNYLLLIKGEYVNDQKHGTWNYYIMNYLNDKIEAVGYKKYFSNELIGLQEYPIIYESINSITILKQISYNYKGNRVFQSFISQYEIFLECGYYDRASRKQGQWTELLQNYVRVSSDFIYFICEKGEYVDDNKNGIWKQYFYQYQMEPDYSIQSKIIRKDGPFLVSEGKYQNDLKTGEWIEPCYYDIENMIDKSLVGQYINNNQIGQWKLKEENDDLQFQGQYENGLKSGQWFEFKGYRHFLDSSSVELIIQENGKYVKGKRSGEWVQQVEDRIAKHSYDDDGDIHSNFKIFQIVGQKQFYLVKIIGEYRNKMKNGLWTTLISYDQQYIICEKGRYNNKIKQGEWIESQLFEIDSEFGTFNFLIMQKGIYDQYGKKIGQWIWEIKNLGDKNMDECEMFQLQGKLDFNPIDDSIVGNFILFGDKFDNFDARLGFFEVFTGTITDGLRDKEWKFADLTQVKLVQSVFNEVSEEVDERIVQNDDNNEMEQEELQENQPEQENQGAEGHADEADGHADEAESHGEGHADEAEGHGEGHADEAEGHGEGHADEAEGHGEGHEEGVVQHQVNSNENSQNGEDDTKNYPSDGELFAQYNKGVLI